MSLLINKENDTVKPANDVSVSPDSIEVQSTQPANNGVIKEVKTDNAETVQPKTANRNNFNDLLGHISTPRPKVASNPNTIKKKVEKEEIEKEIIEDETENNGDENLKKQDPEFYRNQGKFAADLTDIAVPNIIAYLNDEKDEQQYCAESRIKKQIGDAFGRYFEETGKELSAGSQLMYTLGMGYGIPLGMAAFTKGMSVLNKFKEKKIELQKLEIEAARAKAAPAARPVYTQQPEQPQETMATTPPAQEKVKETPATPLVQKVAPNATIEQVPTDNGGFMFRPTDNKKPFHNLPIEPAIAEDIDEKAVRKTCYSPDCDKSFIVGTGHGKGKKTKYYDHFCSKGCMGTFTSMKGVQGRKKEEEKKKNETKKS